MSYLINYSPLDPNGCLRNLNNIIESYGHKKRLIKSILKVIDGEILKEDYKTKYKCFRLKKEF